MKFSQRTLLKLKNKNKKLKPTQYKKLKRESVRGKIKGTIERPRLSVFRSMKIFMHKLLMIPTQKR